MLEEVVRRCKGTVSLDVNPERESYATREAYLRDHDVSGGELDALMAAPNLYSLTFQPDTPVGFYWVFGTSLEHVARRALGILNAEAPDAPQV